MARRRRQLIVARVEHSGGRERGLHTELIALVRFAWGKTSMSSATWPVESAVIGALTEVMNSVLVASISGLISAGSSSNRWRSRGGAVDYLMPRACLKNGSKRKDSAASKSLFPMHNNLTWSSENGHPVKLHWPVGRFSQTHPDSGSPGTNAAASCCRTL